MAGARPQRARSQRRGAAVRAGAAPQREARALPARGVERTVLLAFFVSGVAGLMHQVVWSKLLVQLIGAAAYAQVAVLTVFMGGLALGAARFGRWVDRHGAPLRAYALIECAIGGYCLLLPLVLWAATQAYVTVAAWVFDSPALTLLLRGALAMLVVLPPAVLMGGTLPLLARSLIGRVEDTQRRVAGLYSLNSFGAVICAGLAGFVILPWLGVYASLALASALNLGAGAVVWPLARREAPRAASGAPLEAAAMRAGPYGALQYRIALVALAVSGFAAMGYEVFFTRLIALAVGASTHAFTVMLMAFITGIALGSGLVARRRVERPLWWLAVAQLAVGVSLLAVTPLLARLAYLVGLLRVALQDTPAGFELSLAGNAALCLAVLLVPTTCLGASFPLVAQVQARRPEELGWAVGATYAWNTLGNVLGAALTAVALIPALGALGAFHVNLALSALAGLLFLGAAREASPALRGGLLATAALAAALYLAAGTGWIDSLRFARGHLRMRAADPSLSVAARLNHPTTSFDAWRRAFVIDPASHDPFFFSEDAHASVMTFADQGGRWLVVNGKPDASSRFDLDTQLLLAHAPLFFALQARSLLVIGFGSGVTAAAALTHPLERADIVEISPAVLAADAVFAEDNRHVLADPRVHVYTDDGQSFVRTVPRTYDVIISEPSNPWVAGIGGLFTVEFFTAVRDKLNPGGVFTCWFHTYEQSDDTVALLLRTIGAVFPHVVVFSDKDFGNPVAVASLQPLEPDFAAMEARFATPAVRADLGRLGMPNLAAFLSHHRLSSERFQVALDDGPVNTAGHERLEYAGPRSVFSHEFSYLLEGFDPLLAGEDPPTDALLDRYLAYRAARGEPLPAADLEAAARYVEAQGGYGKRIGGAIRARE